MTLEGWHADRHDPFDFVRLLDGSIIRPANNANFAYFDDPEYNAKIAAANELHGEEREAAFGALDVEIARDAAPWASYAVPNDRYYFSDRVGCQLYSPAYTLNLAALCLRPAISIDDASVEEGDGETRSATFTVTLAEAAEADYPVSAAFATADGTANSSDYEPVSGTVSFGPGETTKTISVDVLGDTAAESTETFALVLSSASEGTIVRAQGQGRIVDDDADKVPPENPTSLASASHEAGAWSNDSEVEAHWSGASDNAGIAGYSVEWSQEAGTVPDDTIDLRETSLLEELDEGDWWVHVRSVDTSGNPASGAAHLGPFRIDTFEPDDPDVASTSHTVGTVSNDNTVEVAWHGAYDYEESGIAGYSVGWTTAAATTPDEVIDTTGEAAASPALADGSWWFHLRTRDNAGNWTSTVHLGPFAIDATAPTAPTLSSPSHTAGTWSPITSVFVRWSGATDGASGVDGYSFDFDADPSTVPAPVKDADEHVNGYATGPMAAASVYFHLRVVDNAGNWSGTVHMGPFLLDPDAPTNPAVRGLTHQPNRPSAVRRISVGWQDARDLRSGVDGFSFEWSQVGTTDPDSTKDAEENANRTLSPALRVGRWWFHLRTRDHAGNWSGAVHLGPFVIRAPIVRPKKQALCHRGRTIKVPKSQVRKHRKHGDKLGACKKRKPRRR